MKNTKVRSYIFVIWTLLKFEQNYFISYGTNFRTSLLIPLQRLVIKILIYTIRVPINYKDKSLEVKWTRIMLYRK